MYKKPFPPKIKDYYLIGDLHSAALVSKDASIDWLCLPHFDSSAIFAKLLDAKGGCFAINNDNYSVSSKYIKNTAIVEFLFKNNDSSFSVKDFMVPLPRVKTENHFLVRKFKGIKGRPEVKMLFNPQPEYGLKKNSLIFIDQKPNSKTEEDFILLHPPEGALLEKTDRGYEITFSLDEGHEKELVLEYISSGYRSIFRKQDFEDKTIKFWRKWVKKGYFFNTPGDNLVRSAITIKLMQFYPTGAIIASPTTSLPEKIGGERNWDYRYVWVRDATFTLYAFYVLGYLEEAERFFEFIESIIEKSRRQSSSPDEDFDLFLMYTITGDPVPKEEALGYLSGYKNSKPVRTGNGARDQFQLDVYGSLIDAYYFISKRKIKIHDLHKNMILNLVKKIDSDWLKKDSGIWEVRSGEQHFTYSKVMAWVGVNRALRMSKKLRLSGEEADKLKKLEMRIHDWIWKNCFDPDSKTFKQYPNAKYQDATNFLFVLLQFLNKHEPLTKTILEQTEKELCYNEIFVYRYFSDDGLEGKEGAFLLCSFWLISAWAILEDTNKASRLFNKLEKFIAESGLLSEEINPDTGEYLGNYPQAFSHIGLILSSYYLHRYSQSK